jgi:hypothetical protein
LTDAISSTSSILNSVLPQEVVSYVLRNVNRTAVMRQTT